MSDQLPAPSSQLRVQEQLPCEDRLLEDRVWLEWRSVLVAAAKSMVKRDEVEDLAHDALVVVLQMTHPVSIEYALGVVRHLAYRQRRRRFAAWAVAEQEQPITSGGGASRRESLMGLVDKVRGHLTKRAQAVAGKVMEGASIAMIASDLAMHRTQVYREIARIRSAIDAFLCHPKHSSLSGLRHVDAVADMAPDRGAET